MAQTALLRAGNCRFGGREGEALASFVLKWYYQKETLLNRSYNVKRRHAEKKCINDVHIYDSIAYLFTLLLLEQTTAILTKA